MFIEEANWVRDQLAGIELPASPEVLNVGSSTEHYRTVEQPHNESEVLAPLRSRGARIKHLDMKDSPGVDLVVDLSSPDLDLAQRAGTFDLVLATGLLEHFDPEGADRICAQLIAATKPGGVLVLTTPRSYRRTPDPIDPGYRPTPADLVEVLGRTARVTVVAEAIVRIDDPRYYKRWLSRSSVVPIGGRWLPLPGASEQLRRLVGRWRWQETCLMVRRDPAPPEAG